MRELIYNIKQIPDIIKNIFLVIKYPFLRQDKYFRYTWQDAVPTGWRKISIQMWDEIKEEMKKWSGSGFHIYDIKEKYGRLVVDAGGPNSVNQIIEKYEYISERTCIVCGAPARYVTKGWISPYCERCIDDYQKANADEYYIDMDWYGYSKYIPKDKKED